MPDSIASSFSRGVDSDSAQAPVSDKIRMRSCIKVLFTSMVNDCRLSIIFFILASSSAIMSNRLPYSSMTSCRFEGISADPCDTPSDEPCAAPSDARSASFMSFMNDSSVIRRVSTTVITWARVSPFGLMGVAC